MGGRGAVSERKVFKGEVDEGGKEMYAEMGNDGDNFGKEGFVEGGEMEVGNGADVFVCGDEIGEKNVFAISEKTWLKSEGGN